MSLRRIATFLALPLAFAIERAAYYGARSVVRLYLMTPPGEGPGLSPAEVARVMGLWTAAIYAAPLLGGILGFAIGPRIPLIAGMALAGLGYFLLGSGPAAPLGLALGLIAVGQGLLKPSIFAVAAQEFGKDRDNLRVALCFALYGAINYGAFAGGAAGGLAGGAAGHTAVFAGSGTSMILAALLAAGLVAVLQWSGPRPEPAAVGAGLDLNAALLRGPRDRVEVGVAPKPLRAEAGAGLVLLAVAPCFLGMSAFGNFQFDAMEALGPTLGSSSLSSIWLASLNPTVVMVTTGLGMVGMLVAGLVLRRSVPVLYGIALALAAFALGSAVVLLGGAPVSLAALVTGTVLTAVAEGLVIPLGISRVLIGSSPRSTPLLAAAWLVLTSLLSWVATAVLGDASSGPLAVSMVLCLISGIALAVLAGRLQRAYFPSPDAAPGAAE